MLRYFLFVILGVFVFFSLNEPVFATMTSTNYKIPSDVISSGGTEGSSTNYTTTDSLGQAVTGLSSSTNYKDFQGLFTNSAPTTLSISCTTSVTMGAIVAGRGQSNLATNTSTCNVITDNTTGYTLAWKADNADLENTTYAITPFTPSGAVPDSWVVAASDAEWGGHLGSGSTTVDTGVWGTSDDYASGLWFNVAITNYIISTRNTATAPTGDDQIVYFGAEIGSQVIQYPGTYTNTVTFTATGI